MFLHQVKLRKKERTVETDKANTSSGEANQGPCTVNIFNVWKQLNCSENIILRVVIANCISATHSQELFEYFP